MLASAQNCTPRSLSDQPVAPLIDADPAIFVAQKKQMRKYITGHDLEQLQPKGLPQGAEVHKARTGATLTKDVLLFQGGRAKRRRRKTALLPTPTF